MLEVAGVAVETPALSKLLLTILSLPLAYLVATAIYNVSFHPLSRFPGPFLHRISRIPFFYKHVSGTLSFDMLDIHNKYGNIVRIAPDELAFSHPDAWKDVMGHRPGKEELSKADWFFRPIESLPRSIINEPREQHGRLRSQLAHGFSDKGMREQEPIIKQYVDLFVKKLRQHSEAGEPLVLSDWYNYCTFDIIGDLAFGEAFGCLEGSTYHAWIAGIFQSAKLGTILQMLSFVPALKKFLISLIPKSVREAKEKHDMLTREKMGLDLGTLVANAELLIIGGSETTATLLSGVTYYILRNPDVLNRLVEEVRTTFGSEDDINLVSVGQLTYMLAVLNEGLRIHPPVANGLPRQVPYGGAKILDQYIPANTYVTIYHWALYRREEYFSRAHEFHPERFLGDDRFSNDRKDALQPFHIGPRNCLGRNLAYSEMRLILARVIYSFDMRMDESSVDWIKQKNYLLWQKGLLRVHLTPVIKKQ